MIAFLFIFLGAYLGGNVYIFIRAAQALEAQSFGVKVLLTLIFWGCVLAMPGFLLLRNIKIPFGFGQLVYEVGTGWLVFTLYMVLLLLFFDLLKLFNIRFEFGFYASLGLTFCLLAIGYYRYQHPATEVINIVINKPVDSVDKHLKVVAISDVHLGYGTGKKQLRNYIRMITARKPDLIVISGDLIDNSVEPLINFNFAEELALLRAPMGVYMVPGNHEYISGIRESMEFIAQTPIHLLRDTVVTLPNGVQLIGRDDRIRHSRSPLDSLVAQTNPVYPTILLDHQPYELEETEQNGIDLQFIGHTHRGQIWPMSLVTDRIFQQSYGYRQWDRSHIYVSSGLSLWGPPFRIGTQSEMVEFNLTFN
ncbi:MAG: metallophosphoesterase [Tannerellaceae bacterium]|nr:metallophosphoesterase [Tannerellaceae bacterium]